MAVVENIAEKKQTPSAQKGVIDYCVQPSKTMDSTENALFVSGVNCVPGMAQESFLATQKVFGHEPDGVRFYHYVQSFAPDEELTPQEAHEIGLELARGFGNREVLVATHIDREHLHNHFVVCAYDFDTGKKLHANKQFLAKLREQSDAICVAHGLSVLNPYDPNVRSERLGPKEYRAANAGNSWKMQLRVCIDHCMSYCRNKHEFFEGMKQLGYDVIWTAERKHITYIVQAPGQRVRDIRLTDEKYLKENMEHEFRVRKELDGRSEGKKSSSGSGDAARACGAYGTDDRGGMDATFGYGATAGSSDDQGTDGTQNAGGADQTIHREDAKSGAGPDGKRQGGDQTDPKRSNGTGWESERESFRRHRQANCEGRDAMVASSRTHGAPGYLGASAVGLFGLQAGLSLLANDEESEEERLEREAKNNGSLLGLALGGVVVALGTLGGNDGAENEAVTDEDENNDFKQTM